VISGQDQGLRLLAAATLAASLLIKRDVKDAHVKP
jgi:hypothetical protein